MKISSIRLGFANNSSSQHGLLFGSTHKAVRPKYSDGYGWDWFHLVSKEDKLQYLSAMVYANLPKSIAPEHKSIICRGLTGYGMTFNEYGDPKYVDHQSVIKLPSMFNAPALNNEFVTEFISYIANNPNITIHGGNDNTNADEVVNFGGKHILTELPRDEYYHARGKDWFVAKKDGKWWILFNRLSGTKLRITFHDDAPEYTHSTTPELVDLKITDKCEHYCPFCYQGSCREGNHADMNWLSSIAYCLNKDEVFEVAIGGGSAELHPDLPKILEIFSNYGVVPNLTVYDLSYLDSNKQLREAVNSYCGGVAVSSIHPNVIARVATWKRGDDSYPVTPKLSMNIPLGCYRPEEIVDAIKTCNMLNVQYTLLGYKPAMMRLKWGTKAFVPFPYPDLKDMVPPVHTIPKTKYSYHVPFGADNLFVYQYRKQLEQMNVHPTLMVAKEGAFSCYIDAVAKKISADSYDSPCVDITDQYSVLDNWRDLKLGTPKLMPVKKARKSTKKT